MKAKRKQKSKAKHARKKHHHSRGLLRVPKTLHVGKSRWDVDDEKEGNFKAIDLYGVTLPTEKRVRIGKHVRGRFRNQIMLHELLHVCFPIRNPVVSHRTEERVVRAITPRLLEILEQCEWERE